LAVSRLAPNALEPLGALTGAFRSPALSRPSTFVLVNVIVDVHVNVHVHVHVHVDVHVRRPRERMDDGR
jgi:hypothetical protein